MKNTIPLLILLFMSSLTAVAQVKVGDNAATIDQSAMLEMESTTQGLLPPRMTTAQRDAIGNPAPGLVIYNTEHKCLEINNGTSATPIWKCMDCWNGNDVDGDGVSDATDTHPNDPCMPAQAPGYTGYDATNVVWRVADCDGDGDTNGEEADCGSDPYNDLYLCLIALPNGLTLTDGQTHYIASCYDENYLPLAGYDANPAATGTANPDGTNEAVTVNIQGSLTTTGVSVYIPYTATNSVNLPAFAQTQLVASEHVQGSNANSTNGGGAAVYVKLSWQAQTLAAGSGIIEATLKAVGSDLNAVKLDINKGIGSNFGILLATFSFPIDPAGTMGNVFLKDIPGIPDRSFSATDHRFLYVPTQANDGRLWLNNNLGADYANLNHAAFNPTQQATAKADYHAYGSLYQWGRLSDEHELITWTSNTSATPVNAAQSGTSNTDVPGHNRFITNASYPYDWRMPQNNNLWQGKSGINNPCPKGFRLPSSAEWIAYSDAAGIVSTSAIVYGKLRLSFTGQRAGNNIDVAGQRGNYWSSTVDGVNTLGQYIDNYNCSSSWSGRSFGFAVRCISDGLNDLFPSGLTLSAGQTHYLVSVYDEDYLPITGYNANVAATGTQAADGSNEPTTVNVQGEDGNVWLNNNLGADYANLNHAGFNLAQQATAKDDHHAYGSLYQWGRLSDGHELIAWTSATAGAGVNPVQSGTSSSDNPGHSNFLISNSDGDWRKPHNDHLWQGINGVNNPCPKGFRLPTESEWNTYISAAGISSSGGAASSALKLSFSGTYGYYSGTVNAAGNSGYYWSSTVSGINARYRYFQSSATNGSYSFRDRGYAVRCVQDAALPSGLTLSAGQTHYLASVYDKDYLPLAGYNANPAATGTQAADGSNEPTTVDVQGRLTTTGVTIKIPYTATSAVNLPAFAQTQTVASAHVQGSNPHSTQGGGAAVDVELSWAAQSLAVGSGTIDASLKAIGSNLNAVKLDINKGIGSDLGIVLATFSIPIDDAGNVGEVKLKDIPGIIDRNFADADHQFLYVPVQGEDGNIWLNNNLGADYANINHASFDPVQQAMDSADYHAYGSLYQWGRLSDGHELMNWTSATAGTGVTGTTTTNATSDTPVNSKFIVGSFNWRVPQNDNLWQGVNGINNPCPQGFRLPNENEWTTYVSVAGISNSATAAASDLKLTVSGNRGFSYGSVSNSGSYGYYWSSTVFGGSAHYRIFNMGAGTSSYYRAEGMTVRCVQDVALPSGLTLSAGQTHYLASVYDEDYLPITGYDANPAATGTQAADGSNEPITVNVQGKLTTTGVTIKIPYTAANAVNLPAFVQRQSIASAHVQGSNPNSTQGGGAAVDVELSWAAQSLAAGSGTIDASLKAIGSHLNAVKLDINKGIGNDLGIVLATFSIPIDNAGATGTILLKDIAGIPDRHFADAQHQFLYFPVQGEDGNIWLNNNLGADYANLNHTNFNPAQQATAEDDYHAYGSLYQWGRLSDGHELITWTSATTGTGVNTTTATNATSDTPADSKFILESNHPYDWRVPQNDNLWQGEAGINNPCPHGFRLPTIAEWDAYFITAGIGNSATAVASDLRLPVSGDRASNSGMAYNSSGVVDYCSSTVNGVYARSRHISSSGTHTNNSLRARGLPVRCVKN